MKKLSLRGGSGTRWGLGGGLIASLCCLGPTVAALFGLTGATVLFSTLKYRPYFLAVGAVFMVAGVGLALRRSRQTCDAVQHRRNLWLFPGAALLSFAVSYGVLTYVTPTLVYRSLTPAASSSQPAEVAADAPLAPAAEATGVATVTASDEVDTASKESTGSQPDATAASPPEVEPASPALEQADAVPSEVAGPRRATLAIQGMT